MSFLLSNYKELGFDGLIAVNGGCDKSLPSRLPPKGYTSSNIGIRSSVVSGLCNGITKAIQFIPLKTTDGIGPNPKGYWVTLEPRT